MSQPSRKNSRMPWKMPVTALGSPRSIWAALPPAPDAHATWLRQRLQLIGGHATLIRASEQVRGAVDVFQPLEAGVAALNLRVKKSFDPRDILNRGRMGSYNDARAFGGVPDTGLVRRPASRPLPRASS